MPRGRPLGDLSGQTFGRLTVVRPAPRRQDRPTWECVCVCGRTITIAARRLRITRSCGCLVADIGREYLTTHGLFRAHPREYSAWQSAKTRCYNPNYHGFHNYGGRGIAMSPAWRDNFPQFLADMGRCPPGHSLDRIDTNGPYTGPCADFPAGNCRWATAVEQHRNTRVNRRITLDGAQPTLAECAEAAGLLIGTLARRLDSGWSVGRAVETPAVYRRLLTLGETTRSVHEWSKATGLTRGTIRNRLRKGWSVERALTTPLPIRHKPGECVVEWQGIRQPLGALAKQHGLQTEQLRGRLRHGWSIERALTEPVKRRSATDLAGESLTDARRELG